MSKIEIIEKKIRELDTDSLEEVNQLVDTLLMHKEHKKDTYLTCNWAGALSELKDQYTSIELQKKILDWWIEEDVSNRH